MRFAELSETQVKSFIESYYKGGKVKEPLMALGVKENFKHIHELFPPEVLEETCEYCGKNLLKKRLARNNTNEEAIKASVYCPNCNHKPRIEKCDCEKCRQKPERLEGERRKTIREYWGKEREGVEFEKLSFREKVFLGSVLRTSCEEDLKTIQPARKSITKIVPREGNLLWEMMNSLAANRALVPSPEAPIDAFDLDDNFPSRYYPVWMQFNLNLKWPYSDFSLYLRLVSPTYYSKSDAHSALQLWIEIASYECIEYLGYQLDLFGVKYEIGEKTRAVFSSLLKYYSVSEIYSIIWISVASVAREKLISNTEKLKELVFQKVSDGKTDGLDESVNKKLDAYKSYVEKKENFGEYVMAYCQDFGNYSEKKKRRIGQFDRLEELPQSEVSEFFFNQVLKIGDNGFYHVPNLKELEAS